MQSSGPIHQHLKIYRSVQNQIASFKEGYHKYKTVVFHNGRNTHKQSFDDFGDIISNEPSKADTELLSALSSLTAVPSWITGTIPESYDTPIYKSSTIRNVKIDEILEAATPSLFGQGKCTRYDPAVRDSIEISASKLEDLSGILNNFDITAMAPRRHLVLKPYKLVIYKEDGHFNEHRDTVREENHIGTLVLILHSDYTGGELVLDHGSHSVSVTGGGNWVAMYGDVIHHIQPVMSGTRVSLIFDIISNPCTPNSSSLPATSSVPDIAPTIESKVC